MYYFVEFSCVITEIWMIHMFLTGFFHSRKLPPWVKAVTYSIFCVIIMILSLNEKLVYHRIVFALFGVWTISVMIFDAHILHGFFSGIALCAIYASTDILAALVFQLFGVRTEALMANHLTRSMYLITCHIIMFGMILLIQIINKGSHEQMPVKILLPVTPCWIISILLCFVLTWQCFVMKYDLHPLFLIVLLGLLYTNIVVIYYTNRIREQVLEKKTREIAEHHYAMQQEYYDQMRIQQEETRALWHDISKYLRASQVDHSGHAVAQVQEMLNTIPFVVDVNNRIVSVILNEYYQIAKTAGIMLELDVQVPPELFVAATDLYVLIGNTMDNAIEACTHLPENQRIISLKLRAHNDILFYEVKNPYEEKCLVQAKNKYHGYGLKNVTRCVERYSGTVDVQKGNGVFCLTAHLNSV